METEFEQVWNYPINETENQQLIGPNLILIWTESFLWKIKIKIFSGNRTMFPSAGICMS